MEQIGTMLNLFNYCNNQIRKIIKLLKPAIWNANGLSRHIQEIKTFIITHFTDRSYIKIPNYQIYDTKYPDDSPRWSCNYNIIKSSIKYHELTEFKRDCLQATSVQIN
jgi:hypothetical protein